MLACVNSEWSLSAPVLMTLFVCGGLLVLARWLRHQRNFPGRHSFMLIHVASLWWLGAAALEMAVQAPHCKMFWASMAWPAILSVPTFWAVFLWQYINSVHKPVGRSRVLALTAMPVMFWLLALANPWHGLFYGEGSGPVSRLPGAPVDYQHGPLFFLAATYGYLFLVFCMAIAVRAAILSKGLYRRHYLAFVVLSAIPWSANIGYVIFDWTLFGFDPTPFSFALTLGAFAWLIVGLRLFDLLPVARPLLLEALLDPVLVIDPRYRVIEANPAALALAEINHNWQGCELADWPGLGPDLQRLLAQGSKVGQEQLLTLKHSQRYYEVRARSITRDTRDGPVCLGQMLYLRDVTQRHLSELKLADALALSEERLTTISSLHEMLQAQALRDPLTGLYNRRYLGDFFSRELARARRENMPIAVALIDLDHFKRLNDTHGHMAGDDALKAVAKFFLERVRNTDAVFRIGGEEFLLILPQASPGEALEKIQKICNELSATLIVTRSGPLRLTLSAGLAHYPTEARNLDELMQKADAELYSAKKSGRNRVMSCSGSFKEGMS